MRLFVRWFLDTVVKFAGAAAGTKAGVWAPSDVFRAALIPAAIFLLTHLMPFIPAASPWVYVAAFALDLFRRLPHEDLPGLELPAPAAWSTTATAGGSVLVRGGQVLKFATSQQDAHGQVAEQSTPRPPLGAMPPATTHIRVMDDEASEPDPDHHA